MAGATTEAWLREAVVTIGAGDSFEGYRPGRSFSALSDTNAARKITFTINNNISEQPNSSVISLYNLSRENRAYVEGELAGKEVILEVGYAGQSPGLSQIFRGDIYRATSARKGTDWVTTIESGDGIAAYRDGAISITSGPGQSYLHLLQRAAESMGLSLDTTAADLEALGRQILNGRTFHGSSHEFIRRICRSTGNSWSIQLGVVQILQEGGASSASAIRVSPATGLIGTPAPVKTKIRFESTRRRRRGSSRSSRSNEDEGGVEVTSLLNPQIYPGALVQVESSSVNGNFVAKKVLHSGDTVGDTWETRMSLFELGE